MSPIYPYMFADFMIRWVDRDFYQKNPKMKILKIDSPAVEITNKSRTEVFHPSMHS